MSSVLHQESRSYVAPFWWGSDPLDAYTVHANGSCFFVEIGGNRFGVTASHVVREFLRCRDEHPSTRLFVRNIDISDWNSRVLADSPEHDIATFSISESEFEAIGIRPLRSELSAWPPPPPMVGRGVFFAGYPEDGRHALNHKVVEFLQESNGLIAAYVDEEEIEVVIDPSYLDHVGPRPPPPTTRSLSGYSGAPLLVVSAVCPGPLFWLGGIVIRQLPVYSPDKPTRVWARRPGCIFPNGALRGSPHVVVDAT